MQGEAFMPSRPGYERRILTALFDTREHAEQAREDLVSAGFNRRDVRVIPDFGRVTTAETSLWESLKEIFLPQEDHASYAEGLRRGGFLVTVAAIGSDANVAARILEREGAVDMRDREAQWSRDGWERGSSEPGEDGNSSLGRRETLSEALRYRSYLFQGEPKIVPPRRLEEDAFKEKPPEGEDQGVDRETRSFDRPES
jgi:hypothetical protein